MMPLSASDELRRVSKFGEAVTADLPGVIKILNSISRLSGRLGLAMNRRRNLRILTPLTSAGAAPGCPDCFSTTVLAFFWFCKEGGGEMYFLFLLGWAAILVVVVCAFGAGVGPAYQNLESRGRRGMILEAGGGASVLFSVQYSLANIGRTQIDPSSKTETDASLARL
jgi:hypothetical protein